MVQTETNLVVADNSGARVVRIFKIYGGTHRRTATVGDIVQCAVKVATPNGKVKKSDIYFDDYNEDNKGGNHL